MRGLRIALRRRFGPLYELARDKTDLNSVADKFRGAFQPSPRIISYLWVSTVRVESSRIAAISFILRPSAISRSTSRCRGVSFTVAGVVSVKFAMTSLVINGVK